MNEIKTFDERKLELVTKGKKAGFITYEELANALRGLELDSDSLDELYNQQPIKIKRFLKVIFNQV